MWLPLSADRSRRYGHSCQHDGARKVRPVAIANEGHHHSQQDHEAADRADARQTKGDYVGAVKDYDQAIQLKPDDGDLLNARCQKR